MAMLRCYGDDIAICLVQRTEEEELTICFPASPLGCILQRNLKGQNDEIENDLIIN